MNKKTLIVLLILVLLVGAFLQYLLCCKGAKHNGNKIGANDEITTTAIAGMGGLTFKGSSLNFSCEDNFNFKENDFNFITPVSSDIDKGILKLKENLDVNPNQKVTIIGYCSSKEPKSALFPNLGFDRANEVKKYFVSKGISHHNLEIDGVVNDKMAVSNGVKIGMTDDGKEVLEDNVYVGPITYKIVDVQPTDNNDEAWKKLKDEVNSEPLVIYFKTNSSGFNLSNKDREKVAKISKYMNNIDDARLLIVGHTDNTGNREANITLSKKRADFVSRFFSKNTGISAERIVTEGKGPDEPIADNNTDEGKSKNRRTVVQLK